MGFFAGRKCRRALFPCTGRRRIGRYPMKTGMFRSLTHVIIILAVAFAGVSFVISMNAIERNAEEDCFNHIQESVAQVGNMFAYNMDQAKTELRLFGEFAEENSEASSEWLQTFVDHFCKMQTFTGLRILWANGTSISSGVCPLEGEEEPDFKSEASKAPYVSDVVSNGESRKNQYVYQAVPIIKDGKAMAVAYGYISLDTLSTFIFSNGYNGKCNLFIIDGTTGDFLADDYHRYDNDGNEVPLPNISSMQTRKPMDGYNWETMREQIANGESGHWVFASEKTGRLFYCIYMPLGINNWSLTVTIDEPTAFATYHSVKNSFFLLSGSMFCAALVIAGALVVQNKKERAFDEEQLAKAKYVSDVRSALISAHSDTSFMDKALQIVADKSRARTILLFRCKNDTISSAYAWSKTTTGVAAALIGANICEEFPTITDKLKMGKTFFASKELVEKSCAQQIRTHYPKFVISNMLIVPVIDDEGLLKAGIVAIDTTRNSAAAEKIECLSSDLYFAIVSIEDNNAVKTMSLTDRLTNVGNRHAVYEYAQALETSQSLGVVYCDVTGLKRVNDTQGHHEGDRLLNKAVAGMLAAFDRSQVFRIGGDEFLILCTDAAESEMQGRIQKMQSHWSAGGIVVACGYEWVDSYQGDPDTLSALAEKRMYQAKSEWYRTSGMDRRRR